MGVLALVVATVPSASALSWGVNLAGLTEAKAAGERPAYGLMWVTEATASKGFSGTNAALSKAKANGVTPVVQWYYWGNSISVNCVKYGCAGKSRGEWNAMATSLAKNMRATLGSSPGVVVIETEFNKNGIQSWPTFDDYLVAQIKIFEKYAPNVKVIIGFGSWGTATQYKLFSDATWRADYAGFQMLRSKYRYDDAKILAAADDSIAMAKKLRTAFPGKALFMTDLAISSWPDSYHAKIQGQAIGKFFDKRGTLEYYGVKAIVYRWVRDFPSASTNDYHGPAEPYWGLKYSDGRAKPAWHVWTSRT